MERAIMLTDLLYDFVCRTFGLSALIPPPVSYTYKTKRVEKGWRSLLVRQLYVKIIRRQNLSNFCVVYIVCRRCLSTFLPLPEKKPNGHRFFVSLYRRAKKRTWRIVYSTDRSTHAKISFRGK